MSNNSSINITFFYPSKIVGGAEYLYIRLALWFSKLPTAQVYVVDYQDGFLAQSLQNSNVQFIEYTDDGFINIPENTTVITPFSHVFKVNQLVAAQAKVLFWSIHPKHLTNYLLTRKWFMGKHHLGLVKKHLEHIDARHALVFMDEANLTENKTAFDLNFNNNKPVFIPICCDDYNGEVKQHFHTSELHLAWVGRIADDKIQSIENIFHHLNQLDSSIKSKITLHVIGEGAEQHRLEQAMAEATFAVQQIKTLSAVDLNQYLIKHIDIGFAMGTSTLEFAKLKIPVVLVDMFLQPDIANNKFHWLFESEGYNLGSYYSTALRRTHAMSDILNIAPAQLAETGQYCYDYYFNNHSLPSVADRLLKQVQLADFSLHSDTLKQLNQLMNPWYFNLLKSVKNKIKPENT